MSLKIFNEIKSLICGQSKDPQKNVQNQIDNLKEVLKIKTGAVFEIALKKAKETICKEKEQLLDQLKKMNGDYYQDPKSTLKIKWDALVLAVHSADENTAVEKREQLEEIYANLNALPEEVNKIAERMIISAKRTIENYKEEEERRNRCQKRLNEIVCTEKTSENFKQRLINYKNLCQKEYEKLCGQFYGDPQGELDQAWKAYQKAETENSLNKNDLLREYQQLDETRKKIEAQLYFADQYLAIEIENPSTYDTIAVRLIEDKIEELNNWIPPSQNEFELETK